MSTSVSKEKSYKCYNELTDFQKIVTFCNYQEVCSQNQECIPFDSFEDYDKEQRILNMGFDIETLECLG